MPLVLKRVELLVSRYWVAAALDFAELNTIFVFVPPRSMALSLVPVDSSIVSGYLAVLVSMLAATLTDCLPAVKTAWLPSTVTL